MKPSEWRQKSVNFAIQYMREHYPERQIHPGTGLRDLVINAFAQMSYLIWQAIQRVRTAMKISSYNDVEASSLDAAADVWFLDRATSNTAKGTWRVYFNEPASLNIYPGMEVGSDSLRYVTNQAYSFNKSVMANNREGSEYYIQFPVEAISGGSEYNVSANSLHEIYSSFSAPWTRATNITAMSGGSATESNAEYYNRLRGSANTRQSIITASSTISTLQSEFPHFDTINIQGFGDEHMNRDKVYGVSGPSGQAPYFTSGLLFREENGNTARIASSEQSQPTLTECKSSQELSFEQYKQASKTDLIYLEKSGGQIYTETFSSSTIDFKITNWIAGDSGYLNGQKKYGNSSYVNIHGLYLGVPTTTVAAIGG